MDDRILFLLMTPIASFLPDPIDVRHIEPDSNVQNSRCSNRNFCLWCQSPTTLKTLFPSIRNTTKLSNNSPKIKQGYLVANKMARLSSSAEENAKMIYRSTGLGVYAVVVRTVGPVLATKSGSI